MNITQKGLLALGAGMVAALATQALRRGSFDFADKVVVITGGSRGLGLVMARQLVAQGAHLALLARDELELERAAHELQARGATVITIPCDVRDQSQVEQAIGEVADRLGRIDVLINNAGVIQVGPLAHMQLEDFENALATHFWGPLYTTLASLPFMRRQGAGRIVNISSIGGRVAVPHLLPYSASKFALVGLSDGLRAELAAENIVVTTVCPGLMRTGSHFNAQVKGRHEGEFTWFSIFDALPLTSMSAERAANQILEACRRGAPRLTITLQAQLLAATNALAPQVTALATDVMNRLLPAPTDARGDELRTGWESQSNWAPSLLTRLADQATVENNNLRNHAPPV